MSDQDPVMSVREIAHAFAQGFGALRRNVRGILEGREQSRDEWATLDDRENMSLHRICEVSLSKGGFDDAKAKSVLLLVLKAIDLFKLEVENLGAMLVGGKLSPYRQELDGRAVLYDVLDLYSYAAADKGVDFRLRMDQSLTVYADRTMFFRMVANLIDNAVKYSFSTTASSRKRFITVELRRHSIDKTVLLQVSSYGVGVLPEELATGSVYRHGTRGLLARDRHRQGSGIGLSEAKRIAEAHGGVLRLESEFQADDTYRTTVSVTVPGGAE